jgi:hypothetical protein
MAIVGGNWTYSGDPAASVKDQVRFLVGDTDGADQLLSDEEILWLVSEFGNPYLAAAQAAEAIYSGGKLVDKKIGDLEIKASMRADQFMKLAKSLRRRAGRGAMPYAGGISIADKDAYRDNTDIPTPAFEEGQYDHPRAILDGDGRHHDKRLTDDDLV